MVLTCGEKPGTGIYRCQACREVIGLDEETDVLPPCPWCSECAWEPENGDIRVGARVRYPRTGTAGRVETIEIEKGEAFARLDSTGLLYRIDTLIPISAQGKKHREEKEDFREDIKKEREFMSSLDEAWEHIDESCEGGG
ncbi:MAG: DUF2098 domain-containing protein [Methanomicrobiales archaeon]